MLYVRNLTQDCTEEKLKECFEQYGKIERVKKIKDYAFIHFEDRDNAIKVRNCLKNCLVNFNFEILLLKLLILHINLIDFNYQAMRELNGKEMGGSHIEVSLAKPPSDKKKKEEVLRARERRMLQMLQGRGG